MYTLGLLLVSLFSLYVIVKAANFFVEGAAVIARRLGIAPFVVGVSIIAIGTSAPELFVNTIAAWKGAVELSVGNILGSNLINTLLGLGLAAAVVPLAVHSRTVWKEFPFMLLSAFILLFVGAGRVFSPYGDTVIDRADALILLSFFIIFIVYTFGLHKNNNEPVRIPELSMGKSVAFVLGGLFGLLFGAKTLVESAVSLAQLLGVSEHLIGLTIVAIGTSLPEIVTSITAVRKGMVDMVVGGIVGSNIFNIFLILGITAFIHPIPFTHVNITDTLILIGASTFVFLAMFVGKKHILQRWQGIGMVLLYIGYILFALWRG